MTHSPTPTELLALRTANAALLESRDSFCDMVATVVFALGSAQLLQSPETAAELAQLRAQASRLPLDDERMAVIRRRRTHCEAARFETEDERPVHVWGPSQYPGRDMCQRCTTERAWAEDVNADEVVLLAEVDRLRARVAELEAERAGLVAARDAQIIAWLGKKAREYGNSNREARDKAEAVGRMADKLSRNAVPVRHFEDSYVSPLHQDHKISHDLPEVPHA